MKKTLLIFVLLLGVVGCSGNGPPLGKIDPEAGVRECFEAGGMWSQDQCVELPEQTLSATLEYKSPDLGINDFQTIIIVDPSSAALGGTTLFFDFDDFTLRVDLPSYEKGTYDASELNLRFRDSRSPLMLHENAVVSGQLTISDSLYDESIVCIDSYYYIGFIEGNFDIEGFFTLAELRVEGVTVEKMDPDRPIREYQIKVSGDFTLRNYVSCHCD
jgi:hypothetical protein